MYHVNHCRLIAQDTLKQYECNVLGLLDVTPTCASLGIIGTFLVGTYYKCNGNLIADLLTKLTVLQSYHKNLFDNIN